MIDLDLAKGRGYSCAAASPAAWAVENFSLCAATIVDMEVRGGAHRWPHVFQKMRHEVRTIPPAYVKPLTSSGTENNGGVCEAMGWPIMPFVSQAVLVIAPVAAGLPAYDVSQFGDGEADFSDKFRTQDFQALLFKSGRSQSADSAGVPLFRPRLP
jgi:hypothetical protein